MSRCHGEGHLNNGVDYNCALRRITQLQPIIEGYYGRQYGATAPNTVLEMPT